MMVKSIRAIGLFFFRLNEQTRLYFSHYRQPIYLKRSSSILIQMLQQKLDYNLKSKNERHFIYRRLSLFDQLYCLEADLKLQQSYLETGLQEQRWPVRFVFF